MASNLSFLWLTKITKNERLMKPYFRFTITCNEVNKVRFLLWMLTKLARNRSNSLTETLIWYGLTHKLGWRQSGDFSSLSPSVLSRGTALNRMTWTRSSRQTCESIQLLNKYKNYKISIFYPYEPNGNCMDETDVLLVISCYYPIIFYIGTNSLLYF